MPTIPATLPMAMSTMASCDSPSVVPGLMADGTFEPRVGPKNTSSLVTMNPNSSTPVGSAFQYRTAAYSLDPSAPI